MSFKERGEAFLANNKRIAFFGTSRSGQATGNGIYKTFRDKGYEVFAIHPEADEIEGDKAYQNLVDVPGGVDAAVVVTSPKQTLEVIKACHAAGVNDVWIHYNPLFGKGMSSVSEEAVAFGQENNMNMIDGGCPMMFFDILHKCMRWTLGTMKKLPA